MPFWKRKQEKPSTLKREEDAVYQTEQVKWEQLVLDAQQKIAAGEVIRVVYFFEDCADKLSDYLTKAGIPIEGRDAFGGLDEEPQDDASPRLSLLNPQQLQRSVLHLRSSNGKPLHLLFAEHHPSLAVEETILQDLAAKDIPLNVTFYVALDEALMSVFGSERILKLMQQMGMASDERISHSMVTESIGRAQKRLDEKSHLSSFPARSAAEWIARTQGK